MERYFYRIPAWHGEFRAITAPNWEEYQNGVRVFTFIEESRNFDSITLLDQSRQIRVLLPIGGGQSFFRIGNTPSWTPLYNVDRIERTFTQQQQNILKTDSQGARDRLDRVLSRLTESIIMPTPQLEDMRRKVRNIFHINLIDPDPADVPEEAFRFAELVANFKTLRTSGFDLDPTFLFEPDYTGPLVAWVVGVDDPTIHVAPSHFYMDRENLIITLIHERTHTVLRLPGHPGGFTIPNNPADGDPNMSRDDAIRNAYCYEWLTAALQHGP